MIYKIPRAEKKIYLGVNVDHVATLRQARGTHYPDPVEIAVAAIKAGGDSITMHLREDRRHIQDADLWKLKSAISVPINLEMAVNEEIVKIAEKLQPQYCCLVPEKRAELTTEGGLDVLAQEELIRKTCARLAAKGAIVSLFIDSDPAQIEAALRCGAPVIELTTGQYADAKTAAEREPALLRIQSAARLAGELGLVVNAGHGLNRSNVQPIAAIPNMHELNIGHSIIADAVFMGIEAAVQAMKSLMLQAR